MEPRLQPCNFSDDVKSWDRKRFIDAFKSVYPLDQLETVADEMGLKTDIPEWAKHDRKPKNK